MRSWLGTAVGLAMTAPALAADPLAGVGSDDFFKDLDSIPPAISAEFGVRVGFGEVTAFKLQTPPWLLFGVRGGMGWHVGETRKHRFGPSLDLMVEGPFPEFYSVILEPAAAWDHVDKGLLIGASAGMSLLFNAELDRYETVRSISAGPSVAVRIGYSQRWSTVMRRMYVVLEPRVRYANGTLAASVSVVVGSGKGW
jgi:hypothetical protein